MSPDFRRRRTNLPAVRGAPDPALCPTQGLHTAARPPLSNSNHSLVSQSPQVVRVILLVSCAHALVHLLEQSVASVEQVISADFKMTLEQSGFLGFALRLPYGIGAFFAGLLADRFGEKRILVLYLLGAAVVAASFMLSSSSSVIYVQLFSMGAFASMYHPAGLSLLANQTCFGKENRSILPKLLVQPLAQNTSQLAKNPYQHISKQPEMPCYYILQKQTMLVL